jgi:hypothetical protein
LSGKSVHRRVILGGILERKERWGLSFRGWFLLISSMIILTICFGLTIHPFLAPTEKVQASVLVVEGWAPPSLMREVAAEFRRVNYQQVILVRPVLDVPDEHESGRSYGGYLRWVLITNGVPENKLATLYPKMAFRDRTYHAALEAKHWLSQNQIETGALNLATIGAHARRSRLLYEKAFGPNVKVGVIAIPSPEYNPKNWWRSSAGVRDIIGETIAYLYARIFFRASEPANATITSA